MFRPLHFCACTMLLTLLAVLTHTAWCQGMCGCEHRYDLLMDLYNSTNGDGWVNKAGWGNMSSCSPTWYGVTCSSGDVTTVIMDSNSLVGTLPSSWWNMSRLQSLDLGSNFLSGSLPSSWGNMSKLQFLQLSSNSLSGPLPSSLSNMSALQYLQLSSNSLSGALPSSWGNMSALQHLHLSSNSLSGSLPSSWGNMSAVRTIYLNSNSLSDSIPSSWGNMSALQQLYLDSNSLTGSLPSSWGDMSKLQTLSLDSNSLSGSLPSSWGNMSALRTMYVHYNSLNGSLPSSWGNMSAVRTIYLNSNSLSGFLPCSWGNMSALEQLYLDGNFLTGSLPSSWGSMSALQQLYLNNNSLSGPLPSSWGNMSGLEFLYLNSNSLIGPLPSACGADGSSVNYVALRFMNLQSNGINGTLPSSWGGMSTLQFLDLSSNSLSGSLPSSWGNMSAVLTMYLSSNSLTGSLPSSWGNMSALQQLYLRSNSLTGKVPGSWANMTNLRYLYLNANCLYGALPDGLQAQYEVSICNTRVVSTVYPCGNTDWAPTCRYLSSSDTSSLSLLASRSLAFAASATVSDTWSPSTASVSRSGTPMCHFESDASVGLVQFPVLNLTQLKMISIRTVVLLQPEIDGTSLPHASNRTNVAEADIRCRSVARQDLLQQPALGAALALAPVLPGCCSITNVTTGALSQRPPYLRIGAPVEGMLSSSMSLIIAPPPNGWLENTALLHDATIRITVLIECGPDSHLSVVLSVPAPGAVRVLAGQVESAVEYSQIASLATVGATSASSLGRLMAVRSMVLCDADSVVGGGVVDLGLTMCEADGAMVAARSAVVSNVVLIAAVAALLLALAAAWSLATHAPLRESLLVLCVPSSLMPAWTAVVPSTSAGAALLFGRLAGSPCAGTDAVLALVGAVVALCPFAALAAFWHLSVSVTPALACTMVTERREKLGEVDDALQSCRWPPSRFAQVLERRWRWRSNPSITRTASQLRTTKCAWVVLLEYRVLWYAALDSLGLAVIACVAVVSGLGGASLCRAWTVVALLLMAGQLAVVVIVQPFTTLFACVHAATTLGLTCVGVLAQLVYVFVGSDTSTSGLWLVEASGVCSLVVVGVSAVKTLLDVAPLLRAVQRRIALLLEKRVRRSPRIARGLVIHEGADDVGHEWDQELFPNSPPADVPLPRSVDDTNSERSDGDGVTALQFWDNDGNARQGVRMQDDVVSDAPIVGYFLL